MPFFCHTYCIKQFNLIHIPLSLIFLALSVSGSHFPLLVPLEPVARLGICLLCLAYTQTALAPFHPLSLSLHLGVCVCVMQMKADTKRIGFHCFRCGFLFLWPDFLLLKFKTFRKSICCRANSLKFPSVSVRIACTYIIKIVDCNIGLIFRRDVAGQK